MNDFTIQLSDGEKEFIERQVSNGGFASASAYVEALVREARKRQAWTRLEQLAAEGLATPVKEMTQADWDDIRRSLAEAAARKEVVHAQNRPT